MVHVVGMMVNPLLRRLSDHVDVDAQAGAVADDVGAVAGVRPRLDHPGREPLHFS